ncbi:CoA ester lyase [Knoellia locipacati]|uniref:HpcH/HpaI aldolase/citrate lyase family protein n=1 Tax=Knoellia locipacati TaxID=882824 RepID=UPI00384CDB20
MPATEAAGTSYAVTSLADARSLLFVPGDRPDRFDKAAASGADLVVLDLEDGVAAEHKDAARTAVSGWLRAGGPAAVRVNALDSAERTADLRALGGLDSLVAVVVPMAEDPEALRVFADALGAQVPLVAQVETAVGVARAQDLAGVDAVARLAVGHLDLAADLGCSPGRDGLLHARSIIVLASRVARLPGPVESVTTALGDPEAALDDAAYARDLGFTGKLAIHPSQVAAIHAAFVPDEDSIRWARRILAVADGMGAVRLDGEMVDGPVIARARAVLHRARVGA